MGDQMRLSHWDVTLAAEIAKAQRATFAWGRHDCATWAFAVRRALTGEDIWPFAGQYRSLSGAKRLLRRNGGDMAGLGRQLLGKPLPAILLAQRGDIVLGGDDPAMGICVGADAAFLLKAGLTFLPLRTCHMAWRV